VGLRTEGVQVASYLGVVVLVVREVDELEGVEAAVEVGFEKGYILEYPAKKDSDNRPLRKDSQKLIYVDQPSFILSEILYSHKSKLSRITVKNNFG
jgi:hypothetical protein